MIELDQIKGFILKSWDLIILLVTFSWLAMLSLSYSETARQMPFTFLIAGVIFISLELLTNILPDPYSEQLNRITRGLSDDVELEFDNNPIETNETKSDVSEGQQFINESRVRITKLVAIICSFGVLSYFVSFLIAIPVFVFGVIFTVGSQNFIRALIVSVLLVAVVWFLFGQVMNTPILEGALIN